MYTHLLGADVEHERHLLDNLFPHHHSLRSTEAAESRVRRQVGFANSTTDSRNGNVVRVETREHGALQDLMYK